jgi:hypothetical protein
MADPLYLSLWFRSFEPPEMLAHTVAVMKQFPFSQQRTGVTYLAFHPVSWSEPTILEKRFEPGVSPEEAALFAAELLHDDYAYVFSAYWDLWTPDVRSGNWHSTPVQVKFVTQGEAFEEETAQETGQVQVEFGVDTPFLFEGGVLPEESDLRVRANIQKLVEFTIKIEKNAGATARLLWSESESNLAQKLISRLQKVQ